MKKIMYWNKEKGRPKILYIAWVVVNAVYNPYFCPSPQRWYIANGERFLINFDARLFFIRDSWKISITRICTVYWRLALRSLIVGWSAINWAAWRTIASLGKEAENRQRIILFTFFFYIILNVEAEISQNFTHVSGLTFTILSNSDCLVLPERFAKLPHKFDSQIQRTTKKENSNLRRQTEKVSPLNRWLALPSNQLLGDPVSQAVKHGMLLIVKQGL